MLCRMLRRYKRRWTVERTFGWLGNFRRLVVRYDRSLQIHWAFFHIACFTEGCAIASSTGRGLPHPTTSFGSRARIGGGNKFYVACLGVIFAKSP